MIHRLNELPRVDHLLAREAFSGVPRSLAREAVRAALELARERIRREEPVSVEAIILRAVEAIEAVVRPRLRPVVNATGVVLHTNLGRAPWSPEAIEAGVCAARYTNLEVSLETGARGGRTLGVERLLKRLTGAEASVVVNNGAAAVLLAVSALAANREVLVSRGELVEIGGSFRVPDVIAAAGAIQIEVGTTNRTHLSDYRSAVGPKVALVMRVHRSNFTMSGFVTSAERSELIRLAAEHQLIFYEDAGSGCLVDGASETSVRALVQAGVDLVSFSGDKLIGGPQAGLIVGSKQLIDRLRSHPMYRALRLDKVRIAALEATLTQWLVGQPPPVAQMIALTKVELTQRAEWLNDALLERGVLAEVFDSVGCVGGGSAPDVALDARVVRVKSEAVHRVARRLRLGHPAIVCRVHDGALLLDPRTVLPDEMEILANGVARALLKR